MTPSENLLRRFAKSRSQKDFEELVRRYSSLVFSTALRRLNGDRSSAEEVMQDVFSLLARKSESLKKLNSVSAWLYRQSCRLSANHMRKESRRLRRETIAHDMMKEDDSKVTPALLKTLDEALLALPESARHILSLRFFDETSHRALGSQLGISEEAARKRVSRALEALKSSFKKQGISTSIPTLTIALSTLQSETASAATIQKIAGETILTSSSTSLLGSLLSLTTGIAGVSLIAGIIHLSHPNSSHAPHLPAARQTTIEHTHIERDLIQEIKRMSHLPQHLETRLQLEALLEELPISEINDFVLSSQDRLTRKERETCYLILFQRWVSADPQSALNASLSLEVEKLVQPMVRINLHSLTGRLLEDWMKKDRDHALSWLAAHLGHRAFQLNMGPRGTLNFQNDSPEIFLNEYLASVFTRKIKNERNTAPLLKWVNETPLNLRASILHQIISFFAGEASVEIFPEIFDKIDEISNPTHQERIATIFWQRWKYAQEDIAEKFLRTLSPQKQLEARLAYLGGLNSRDNLVTPESIELKNFLHRSFVRNPEEMKPITLLPKMENFLINEEAWQPGSTRERDALTALFEQGYSEQEALNIIARQFLLRTRYDAELIKWMTRTKGLIDYQDQDILQRLKTVFSKNSFDSTDLKNSQGATAIFLAEFINDRELSLKIARIGFQYLISENPLKAEKYLDDSELSPEFSEVFQTITQITQ